jgi:hypothetical protein
VLKVFAVGFSALFGFGPFLRHELLVFLWMLVSQAGELLLELEPLSVLLMLLTLGWKSLFDAFIFNSEQVLEVT